MPWEEKGKEMERTEFIKELLDGERMTELCKRYGISRKTGYKFKDRYERYGLSGLLDQSRRPLLQARKTSPSIERLIIETRQERPTWGAAKLGVYLRREHPALPIPARSTIHEILDRHGLIKRRRKRKFHAHPTRLRKTHGPNELWCADYKGHFRLGNGRYCYPLTLSDHFSRYLLACEALENTRSEQAYMVFCEAFEEYGLPAAIRTDNGAPFSSRGLLGLSQLSVWWLKLGIEIERIEPGQPQQNGRHERMHLTLKQETTRPAGAHQLQQQERFDLFNHDYNQVRPHEALDMLPPAAKYKKSSIKMPQEVPDPEYPDYDHCCYVSRCGKVFVPRRGQFNLSSLLGGELVGLKEVEDDLWLVSFATLDLGYFDTHEGVFHVRDGSMR